MVDKQKQALRNTMLILLTVVMATSGTIVITNYLSAREALILFIAAFSLFVFVMVFYMRRKR